MTSITSFYTGGQDNKGRTLDSVLAFSDNQFEGVHDFIQWIFPLHEKSLHSVGTPVLTPEDIQFLSSDPTAIANAKRSIARFQEFLGVTDPRKYRRWAHNGDHNLLRITRAIRSLRLFGLETEAKNFYEQVKEIGKQQMLSPTTLQFWDKAANDDLGESMTANFLKMKQIKV
jgi:hypothetical protein